MIKKFQKVQVAAASLPTLADPHLLYMVYPRSSDHHIRIQKDYASVIQCKGNKFVFGNKLILKLH